MELEANNKNFQDSQPGSSSVLRSSISKYGKNSYYYAHADVQPADEKAVIFSGPGIVTGGTPEKIELFNHVNSNCQKNNTASISVKLRDYSWHDAGKNVKISFSLNNLSPGWIISENTETVKVEFQKFSLEIKALLTNTLDNDIKERSVVVKLKDFCQRIVPEQCSYCIKNNDLFVRLAKHDPDTPWFRLLKTS